MALGAESCAPGAACGCLAAVKAATQRPPSPERSASRAGRAPGRAGEARIGPRREEELAEPWPWSLRGPGCNFSLEAQTRYRAPARSHSGTRVPGDLLPRTPSVCLFLTLFILTL